MFRETGRWVIPFGVRTGAWLATVVALGAFAALSEAKPAVKAKVLLIGASGSFVSPGHERKEAAAHATLQDFIKSETGLKNEILNQKNWSEVAEKMANGELHLGMFQGHEFAWAQEKYPALKPLALAVNVYRYPTVCVVTGKDSPVTDFEGLRGLSLAMTGEGNGCVQLFVERQCRAGGYKPDVFFSRLIDAASVEDALDDAVDGTLNAVAVERAGLDAYKRRKPGRFTQLKELTRSRPLAPPVVAYYEKGLSPRTLQRFRDGLVKANQKEKGQTILTLFRLTRFEKVPSDFKDVLAETRLAYPALAVGEK